MIHFPQYYLCGEKKFTNIFEAFDHQKISGHFPRYRLDPELIDSLTNIKRPKNLSKAYIVKLMIKGLKRIRQVSNKKLRLCLGGGTDSWTIMKLCVENDIFLDEVVTGLPTVYENARADLEYIPALRYAKKYEGQGIGVVKIVRPEMKDLNYVYEKEWYKKTSGPVLPCRPFFWQIYKEELLDHNYINLIGYEKPHFKVEDGKIFLCYLDFAIGEWMRVENSMPVFIDKHNPELLVAMAYMMLDNIPKKILKKDNFIKLSGGFSNKKLEIDILNKLGMTTERPWLNFHYLGKKPYDQNLKTKYFYKQLESINMNDFRQQYLASMEEIHEEYKELPQALERDGNLVKTVGRFSQKISILSDGFGQAS